MSKMKNGKAAGPSGVAAGETGIEMITNLTNQIVRGVILQPWILVQLSTITR